MIVKEVLDNIASELRSYEVYEEKDMTTTDGQTVKVLNLIRTTNKSELNTRIQNIQNQIDSLTTMLEAEQEILNSIEEK